MRYLPHTLEDVDAMLEAIGVDSIDDLFEQIPEEFRLDRRLELPEPKSELTLERHLGELASKNAVAGGDVVSFLGAGLYDHHSPHALQQLLLRAEYYTSYTPYQPEISQGTTKSIFEFQSMVAELLGVPIANASMYDGAHATAEAALMAQRVGRKRDKVYVAESVHPEYRQVIQTYLSPQDDTYREIPVDWETGQLSLEKVQEAIEDPKDAACIIFQTPNFFGVIEDPTAVVEWAHEHKIKVVASFNEPLAFALTTPPGHYGADIVAGEGTSLGIPMGYGGPALGIFGCREKLVRKMPGRLAGYTVDTEGREGYVLTLSTREQHIRREKATSNICTNQGLMALAAGIYMSLMGKEGIREMAQLNLSRAHYAMDVLESTGQAKRVFSGPFFNEFVVETRAPAKAVVAEAAEDGILPGFDLGRANPKWQNYLLVAVTEKTSRRDIDRLANYLSP
ncbi:aminomethyl-transferring glycine dehydrogenase subunit GcvPA [Persicimonas caeni]|uniref:Probable glycine dehydrogenase (decarboxylating) subunit 1 n=1 Tax=Persicimonas caeni TaxID=2292766 RepID=A0A4Y6Q1M4_PERCE|nr:aminomethyl-transferring glycine dehydrogenase subunit GcvPA [Persicimonas caeni]QDG54501.1 aminomethyl-transferring glycine dehydrogenase subunit GcvPA [Persicimonas caeni]QED35722.1 aminomethyl-transferring glycine dehydrogenase subunit GcvPA [Persicimonas caeni]